MIRPAWSATAPMPRFPFDPPIEQETDTMTDFKTEITSRTKDMTANPALQKSALDFLRSSAKAQYSYNFHWMDRPIIQYPQDIVAMQELIYELRPDLIIETGIAHGGSLVFSASMLAMLDMVDAIEAGESLDPAVSKRKVLGIDIDIRAHNRAAIDAHPMRSRIEMIQGSSVAPEIISQVRDFAADYKKILICLDSNHTHEHVLEELRAYAPLTSSGSYCVVFDTLVEDMEEDTYTDRPWGKGNNPYTAVQSYLQESSSFEIDSQIHERLLITVAKGGFLRRID
jgi:cephalosporin hydroxylase